MIASNVDTLYSQVSETKQEKRKGAKKPTQFSYNFCFCVSVQTCSKSETLAFYFSFLKFRFASLYNYVLIDNAPRHEYLLNEMEKIQIQAARIITGTNNYAHKHLLYLETGWEKLSKRREYHRLILLYKILNGLAPQHLCNIFLSNTNFNNGYNLRHNNMQLIYSRTETFLDHLFPLLRSDCGTSSTTQ